MNGNTIFEILSNSSRWGINDQPSIYWATGVLEQLPVKDISVIDDRMQVTFTRDLSPLEHWGLLSLNPDDIKWDKDTLLVDLWWD